MSQTPELLPLLLSPTSRRNRVCRPRSSPASHNPTGTTASSSFRQVAPSCPMRSKRPSEAELEPPLEPSRDHWCPPVRGGSYLVRHGSSGPLPAVRHLLPGGGRRLDGLRIRARLCQQGGICRRKSAVFPKRPGHNSWKSSAAEPNGLNINENCGSTDPRRLARPVVAKGADLGLAFDGDADRVIAVDAGGLVDGDRLIALFAGPGQPGPSYETTVVVTWS